MVKSIHLHKKLSRKIKSSNFQNETRSMNAKHIRANSKKRQ